MLGREGGKFQESPRVWQEETQSEGEWGMTGTARKHCSVSPIHRVAAEMQLVHYTRKVASQFTTKMHHGSQMKIFPSREPSNSLLMSPTLSQESQTPHNQPHTITHKRVAMWFCDTNDCSKVSTKMIRPTRFISQKAERCELLLDSAMPCTSTYPTWFVVTL